MPDQHNRFATSRPIHHAMQIVDHLLETVMRSEM
jgi:hypothetical protein